MSRTLVLIGCLIFSLSGFAAEDRGHEIFAQRDLRDSGWTDSSVAYHMELRTGDGRSVSRQVRVMSLEGGSDAGDQILLIFDAPADVAGTALLTHDDLEPDQAMQWLYLPAYKRVRRIASANRSGRFMGTEFTYEDLLGDPLEDFSYRYQGEADYRGRKVYRIERTPLGRYSAYGRQDTFVDEDTLQVVQAVLYDRDGHAVKRYEADDWRLYQDRYWRSHKMVMTDLDSGRSTILTASDYELNSGLRESDFRPAALSRTQ